MDCVFCSIVKGDIPCYKIYETDRVLAFLDISCDAELHTLVVPKQHARNMLDCPSELFAEVMCAAQAVAQHYVSMGFEGFNIAIANEPSAEQTVFHLHVHVVPRRSGDGLHLNHVSSVKHSFNLAEQAKKYRLI